MACGDSRLVVATPIHLVCLYEVPSCELSFLSNIIVTGSNLSLQLPIFPSYQTVLIPDCSCFLVEGQFLGTEIKLIHL